MKKNFRIISILIVAALAAVSCKKENSSDPTPKKQTYTYEIVANVEMNEEAKLMYEFTGSEFACGSESCDLCEFFSNSLKYSFSKKSQAPCKTHLKFIFTPKTDFTPETGRKYDVNVAITYSIIVTNDLTKESIPYVMKKGGINAVAVDFDEAQAKRGLSPVDVLTTMKRVSDFDESYTIGEDGSVK